MLGLLDIQMQKDEVGPRRLPYRKINSEWINDPNESGFTIGFLKKAGLSLCGSQIWQQFLKCGNQSTSIKRKNRINWASSMLKTSVFQKFSKGIINKVKKNHRVEENICKSHI